MSHAEPIIPPDKPLRTMGHCIWCGKRPPEVALTEEHVVPFSFGGHWVLPEGCCKACEVDQSAYIGRCCHMMFRDLRLHHKLPSKKRSTKTIRLMTGEQQYTEFSPEIAPGHVVLPVFDAPLALTGAPVLGPLPEMVAAYITSTTDDASERQRALKQEFQTALTYSQIPPFDFIRVLAHIGHSYYVSNEEAKTDSLLLPIALGNLRNASMFVGGSVAHASQLPEPNPGIHQIAPFSAMANGVGYVAANVRLFIHLEPPTPTYTLLLCQRDIPHGENYVAFSRQERTNAIKIESLIMGA